MNDLKLLDLKVGDKLRLVGNDYSPVKSGDIVTVLTLPAYDSMKVRVFSVATANGQVVAGCAPFTKYWTPVIESLASKGHKDYGTIRDAQGNLVLAAPKGHTLTIGVEKDNSKNNPFDGRAYRSSKSAALRRIGTITRLRANGESIRDIADKLDLTKSSVHRAIHTVCRGVIAKSKVA